MNKKTQLIEQLLRSVFDQDGNVDSSVSLTLNLIFPNILINSVEFIDQGLIKVHKPTFQKNEKLDLKECFLLVDGLNVDLEAWFCDCKEFKALNLHKEISQVDDLSEFGKRYDSYSFGDGEMPLCSHLLSAILIQFNPNLLGKIEIKPIDINDWLNEHLELYNDKT